MSETPEGHLYIGGETDPSTHERSGETTLIEASDLTTHGVIVGMTGSGKTGLGMICLEEALLQGIPTIVIDPKGDMGNLDLVFADFAPSRFEPWINPADAERDGVTVAEHAATVAETWRSGLEGWGIGTDRMNRLAERAVTIYTPGSSAGVPLNLIGNLAAPPEGTGIETVADEIEGFVTSLLGLIDIDADPLSSREHILLSNLIHKAWSDGTDLDLAQLLGQIQDPPLRKLGVMELESFYPKADRTALALKLNGLLASPAFGSWMQGVPLDVAAMLDTTNGAKASVISLGHLSESERQFVVTILLSKVITWMRAQSGTPELRALIYMDEVFGYVPPTAQPPAKKPILTILKQARAFGVGMMLSTQNPVDLDYKAISNSGTWLIGRLQTERDKARLLEGMESSSGEVDLAALDATISGLEKREFIRHQTGSAVPTTFTTRWAMSYLAGPLTKDQLATLTAEAPERSQTTATPTGEPAPTAATVDEPDPLADDESSVAPTVAESIDVVYLDPAAPWAGQLGASATGGTLNAALVARVDLLFDETKADLRHEMEWEAVIHPIGESPAGEAILAVDYDDRDLRATPPEKPIYRIPDARIDTKRFFTSAKTSLKEHLYRSETVALFHNEQLKLYSRVGESREEFDQRCIDAADDEADKEAEKIRVSLEKKLDRIRAAVAKAEDRVRETSESASSQRSNEMLSGAMDVLGGLLGGGKSTRSILGGVKRAGSKRRQSQNAAERVETAKNRLAEKVDEHEALEDELQESLLEIQESWEEAASEVTEIEVGLEKTDITVGDVKLLWFPVA